MRWPPAAVQLLTGLFAGSGGGKDSKKQKTDSSLPQSMLSSFLKKGWCSPFQRVDHIDRGRLLTRTICPLVSTGAVKTKKVSKAAKAAAAHVDEDALKTSLSAVIVITFPDTRAVVGVNRNVNALGD